MKRVLYDFADRETRAEAAEAIRKTMDAVRAQAQDKFKLAPGGFVAKSGVEFAETNVLPRFLTGYSGSALSVFKQTFGSANKWLNIFNGTGREDVIVGIAGFIIPDNTLRATELRYEVSDRKYPCISLEEAKAYDQPSVILDNPIIIIEEESYTIKGRFETLGKQTIIPFGVIAAKKKADVITEHS